MLLPAIAHCPARLNELAGPCASPPAPNSLGYSGPRLAPRPNLGSVSPRQAREAHGRVVFDDADARMAAYDAVEVTTTVLAGGNGGDFSGFDNSSSSSSGIGSGISGSGSGGEEGEGDGADAAARWWGAGGWDAERWRLASFNSFAGPPLLLRLMKQARLNRPTPVQAAAIPVLMAGRDLLLAAPPGSGATASYLIPMLRALTRAQRPRTRNRAAPPALVLAPSRELAAQVAAEAARLCAGGKLKVVCVTGGADAAQQRLALRGGCDLLVATPGRLLDLAARGAVDLRRLRWLVLEEAEALLGPGLGAAARDVVALHLQGGGSGGGGGAPSKNSP